MAKKEHDVPVPTFEPVGFLTQSKRTGVRLIVNEDGSLSFSVMRDGSTVHVFEYPAED